MTGRMKCLELYLYLAASRRQDQLICSILHIKCSDATYFKYTIVYNNGLGYNVWGKVCQQK